MDKYEVLSKSITARYPLRVFMRHGAETSADHLKECLEVAEATNDEDYYFLTVECGRKLFGVDILEKTVKEAIYVASTLYQHPYEKVGSRDSSRESSRDSFRGGFEAWLRARASWC
jgi:hypothetical protein